MRAHAVEMHLGVSQEPLYTEIHRSKAADQNEPRTQTHTTAKMHVKIAEEQLYTEIHR